VLEGDTRHPYRLQCEQWKLSELLEKLQRSPFAEVRFASKVEAATDNGDHVSVEIENDGRRETCAPATPSADGARSAIRRSMGLPFEGLTYPETTLLVTTLFHSTSISKASRTSHCWKENGNFSCCAAPPLARVDLSGREYLIDDQMTPEALDASLQIMPRQVLMTSLSSGLSRAHAHGRHLSPGSLLLAGDAAHSTRPPAAWPQRRYPRCSSWRRR
jgi:3-(3-hydroxy-phenyl)propionate hydroxylase